MKLINFNLFSDKIIFFPEFGYHHQSNITLNMKLNFIYILYSVPTFWETGFDSLLESSLNLSAK